jgi:hypothetical protein
VTGERRALRSSPYTFRSTLPARQAGGIGNSLSISKKQINKPVGIVQKQAMSGGAIKQRSNRKRVRHEKIF